MVIIVGATGFIGHYTTKYFVEKGIKVLATGRSEQNSKLIRDMGADFIEFDMTKEEDILKLPTKNVEAVIVLAGLLPANSKTDIEKDENAAEYFKINTIGVINILEYCRKNNIKKIISTCSYADVYNSWRAGYPIKETDVKGQTIYTADGSDRVEMNINITDSKSYTFNDSLNCIIHKNSKTGYIDITQNNNIYPEVDNINHVIKLVILCETPSNKYNINIMKMDKATNTIYRNIKVLKDMGILERVGSNKKGYWRINY